jgi:hypothetical protein
MKTDSTVVKSSTGCMNPRGKNLTPFESRRLRPQAITAIRRAPLEIPHILREIRVESDAVSVAT